MLYRAYCEVWRHRQGRKGRARRRGDFHHGLLEEIGAGGLSISRCGDLESLEGLESLQRIGGLGLSGPLPALSSLPALPLTPGAGLGVVGNEGLKDLRGLEALEVASVVNIQGAALETLEGLNNLRRVEGGGATGSVVIEDAQALVNVDALSKLERVDQDVRIRFSDSIESLAGLASLEHIGGSLTIRGLNSIDDVSSLDASAGGSLTSLGASESGGSMEITLNDELPNCSAVSVLEAVQNNGFAGAWVVASNMDDACPDTAGP